MGGAFYDFLCLSFKRSPFTSSSPFSSLSLPKHNKFQFYDNNLFHSHFVCSAQTHPQIIMNFMSWNVSSNYIITNIWGGRRRREPSAFRRISSSPGMNLPIPPLHFQFRALCHNLCGATGWLEIPPPPPSRTLQSIKSAEPLKCDREAKCPQF